MGYKKIDKSLDFADLTLPYGVLFDQF